MKHQWLFNMSITAAVGLTLILLWQIIVTGA